MHCFTSGSISYGYVLSQLLDDCKYLFIIKPINENNVDFVLNTEI